jgi:hypothetical protein
MSATDTRVKLPPITRSAPQPAPAITLTVPRTPRPSGIPFSLSPLRNDATKRP